MAELTYTNTVNMRYSSKAERTQYQLFLLFFLSVCLFCSKGLQCKVFAGVLKVLSAMLDKTVFYYLCVYVQISQHMLCQTQPWLYLNQTKTPERYGEWRNPLLLFGREAPLFLQGQESVRCPPETGNLADHQELSTRCYVKKCYLFTNCTPLPTASLSKLLSSSQIHCRHAESFSRHIVRGFRKCYQASLWECASSQGGEATERQLNPPSENLMLFINNSSAAQKLTGQIKDSQSISENLICQGRVK